MVSNPVTEHNYDWLFYILPSEKKKKNNHLRYEEKIKLSNV